VVEGEEGGREGGREEEEGREGRWVVCCLSLEGGREEEGRETAGSGGSRR